jgi:hypothetical protein
VFPVQLLEFHPTGVRLYTAFSGVGSEEEAINYTFKYTGFRMGFGNSM